MSIQNKVESVETVIKPTREEAEEAVRTLICWTGDNPDREGLIAVSYTHLTLPTILLV